jgi:SAM-dependent methyltransferase
VRNASAWSPSKFEYIGGRLRASRNVRHVGVASRLNADLVAAAYEAALPRHAKGRLLDLGCGNIPLYAAYRHLVSECTCVDWGNTAHKNVHLDLECDLSQPLPFADGQFDSIILSDVLEHVPTPEALWREMTRTLAPGGKIILNVPFLYWLHEEPYDFYRYTEFALRRFVEISGLTLVVLRPIGGAPEVLSDVLAKNIVRLPLLGRALAAATQSITYRLVRTRWGKAISEKTAARFPLGYFLVATKTA